jgi:hypothetical protein
MAIRGGVIYPDELLPICDRCRARHVPHDEDPEPYLEQADARFASIMEVFEAHELKMDHPMLIALVNMIIELAKRIDVPPPAIIHLVIENSQMMKVVNNHIGFDRMPHVDFTEDMIKH